MGAYENVSFGQFGDHRDERSGPQKYGRNEMYQPPGSKLRFELQESNGNVTARKIGKPDEILPGGRAAKALAGGLHVWGGGTSSPEGHKEVLRVDVKKGYRGKGLADAMLRMSVDRHPNLSHSAALYPDGARFAMRNQLPGDTERSRKAQGNQAVADAASAMLGGPRARTKDYD